MTDPSSDQSTPLTRRQARLGGSAPQEPAAPGEGTPAAVGPSAADAAPADPAPAPSERTRPATLAETAAREESEPAPDAQLPASLEDLFVPENMVDTKPKKRGRGCLVALIVFAIIAGGLTAGGFWVANTYGGRIAAFLGWDGPSDYEPGEATGEAVVTIEEGDGGEIISQKLYDAGVTLKPTSFYDYLVENDPAQPFYPGAYRLQQKMTSEAALAAIEDPANKLENAFAVPEGLTVDATLEAAAAGLAMPLDELQAAVEDPAAYDVAADSLEGWLFPAYYTFDPGVTAEDVVRTMVERTRESLASAGVPAGEEQRILTVASIIQREARFEDDFYKVSRVIYNRLDESISDTDGLLQMDSTAQYGYGEMHDGTVSSSEEALRDDNPWNTYVHPGLPVGPIANPGDLAIDAAMNPADGRWQYFVTVNLETGETVFSETLGEHERAIEQWHAWCEANPNSGC
ncbi:endolytic transglycosylase MltG [Microbacterium lacusdiani]